MLDEDEMQRRELSRLLSTAKSKDRKDLIRSALNKLENGNEDRFDFDSPLSMNPAIHASLFSSSHSIPNLEIAVNSNITPLSHKQQMMRPMSARRRPSTPCLLDAIPENQALSNKSSEKHNESAAEIFLPPEDVADVVVSSGYDPRFLLPKFCFFHNSPAPSPSQQLTPTSSSSSFPNSIPSSSSGKISHIHGVNGYSSSAPGKEKDKDKDKDLISKRSDGFGRGESVTRSYWMSTGLLPQFMKIVFCDTWTVRRVEIHCHGIEEMNAFVLPSSNSTSLGGNLGSRAAGQMIRISEDYFVFDFGEEQLRPQVMTLSVGLEKDYPGSSPGLSRPTSRSSLRSPGAAGGTGSGGSSPLARTSSHGSSLGLSHKENGNSNGILGSGSTWSGVTGKGLLIVVQQTSELFFGLLDVKIRVFPYT